jgi:fermentation-respiration switch protein FrsA (DUF1100 family)
VPVFVVVLIIVAAVVLVIAAGGIGFFEYSIKRREPEAHPKSDSDPNDPWTVMKPVMDEGKAWINSHKLDRWEITSFDGLKLVGHYFPAEDKKSKKVMLMMHGYRSYNFNDFCRSAKYFHEAGYNILLADQRCHGESEGKYICFGINERYDCRDWANEIVKKTGDDCSIFLMGVSMGCATVTMALGLDLPKNVLGCISDCGFTSPADIFRHILRSDFHLPDFPFMYTQKFLCKYLAHFDIYGCSTLDVLKTNKRPVLFIHGGQDTFVPTYMTMKNYEACTAEKELYIVDQATHAQSFLVDPEGCWKKMKEFIEKYS